MTHTAHDWKTLLLNEKVEEYVSFHPWAYTRPDGSVSTAIGSSRAVLLVDGNHTEASPIPHDQRGPGTRPIPPSGKTIDVVFTHDVVTEFRSTVAALRAVCPASFVVETVNRKCESCGGRGYTECYACEQDCDCEDCDGSGTTDVQEEPDRVLVKIGGHRFDTWIFGRLLRLVPDGEITIAVTPFPGGLLRIVGDGWKLITAHTTQTEDVTVIDFPTTAEPAPLAHPSESAP